MASSHELVDHTSELAVRLRASTLGELLREAGVALGYLLRAEGDPVSAAGPRRITVAGRDREALLVHWLNELLYVAETDRWVATAFTAFEATETSLSTLASGVTLSSTPSRIKAVTFHGLRIHDVSGELRADIVLDV